MLDLTVSTSLALDEIRSESRVTHITKIETQLEYLSWKLNSEPLSGVSEGELQDTENLQLHGVIPPVTKLGTLNLDNVITDSNTIEWSCGSDRVPHLTHLTLREIPWKHPNGLKQIVATLRDQCHALKGLEPFELYRSPFDPLPLPELRGLTSLTTLRIDLDHPVSRVDRRELLQPKKLRPPNFNNLELTEVDICTIKLRP